MFRKLFVSWKNKKGVLLTIILGYFFCITFVSMMANQVVIEMRTKDNMNMGNLEKRAILTVTSDSRNDFTGDPIEILQQFSKHGKVDVLRLEKQALNVGNSIAEAQICPVLFEKQTDWTPLLSEGRYLTPAESIKGENYILLGKTIASKLKLGINDSINFYDKSFKIIGILGQEYRDDEWDNTAVMSLKALPPQYSEVFKEELIKNASGKKQLMMDVVLRVKKDELSDSTKAVGNYFKDYSLTMKEVDGVKWNSKPFQDSLQVLLLAAPIIFVALFNVISISFFWISDRKKEITIKKALGATNRSVINSIRKEMLALAFIASILSLLVQVLLERVLQPKLSTTSFSLQISWTTFAVSTLVSLFLGYFATMGLAKRIISMEPAEALRYE